MPTTMIGLAVTLAFSLVAFTMPTSVWAAGPTLTVSADGDVHTFDRDALLARKDVVEITTSRDVAYGTPRTYRAVALAKLLEGVDIPPDAVVEAAAQDGFVTQLSRDLVYATDGIVGYMAIEVADTPWPSMPGKDKSAGPFYIVWLGDQASSVPIMKWPYQVVSLSVQDAPARRWPSLAVDPMLPPPSGARRANHLREQMLHLPYDEPGRIGVGWPRSEFADEPDGVLHRCRFARADPRSALGSSLARAADARLCRRGPER